MQSKEGVLVASSYHIEYLLPWWWYHYHLHNRWPVAFVDLGMSKKARAFCEQKGELISFHHPVPEAGTKEKVDQSLATRWEKVHGSGLWQTRTEWFKKPFALTLSPFEKTVWLDLDCEVRAGIEPLLTLCKHGIALTPEAEEYQEVFRQLGFCDPSETIYNSGVMPYLTKSPILSLWKEEVSHSSHKYLGDQDALSSLLYREKVPFASMPYEMNWDRGHGPNPDALIFHWHGLPGKEILKEEILTLQQMGWIESLS